MWRNQWRIWFSRPYDNCTWRVKSSFLYGGSRHHPTLKFFKLVFLQSWNSSIWHFVTKSSNFQNLQILQNVWWFSFAYIYIAQSSTSFTYSSVFNLIFHLSECDRTRLPSMLSSIQSILNSSYAFYLTLVQSPHSVLVS